MMTLPSSSSKDQGCGSTATRGRAERLFRTTKTARKRIPSPVTIVATTHMGGEHGTETLEVFEALQRPMGSDAADAQIGKDNSTRKIPIPSMKVPKETPLPR
jgi:hypothetical protein